jgi:hypothetical protein
MKRTLAIICSSVLALSIAPLASAAAVPATAASGNVVGVTIDAPIFERIARKSCTTMCVQSTLPTIDHAAYFVNDNSALLSFSSDGLVLRMLDNDELLTLPYAEGFSANNLMTSISNDQDEVYFYDTLDSDDSGHVFRVTTVNDRGNATLSITDVTPESPTYPLYGNAIRGLAVAPDNSGYFYIYRPGETHRVCQFDETGIEVACSEAFDSSSETSRIFMNFTGDLLFVMGDVNKRFAFDVAGNLSLTHAVVDELTGTNINFERGTQTTSGDMLFVDQYVPNKSPAETTIYSIHMDGDLIDSYTIPGNFSLDSIVAPARTNSVFLLGVGYNSRGYTNSYRSLYQFRATATYFPSYYNPRALKMLKHIALKPRGNESEIRKLTADDQGRYLLAFDEGSTSKVIPLKRPGIELEVTRNFGGNDVTITWEFINLVPRRSLTGFRIEYKAPGTRRWQVVHTDAAIGNRVHEYGPVANRSQIRVVPVGVKLKNRDIDTWTSRTQSGG